MASTPRLLTGALAVCAGAVLAGSLVGIVAVRPAPPERPIAAPPTVTTDAAPPAEDPATTTTTPAPSGAPTAPAGLVPPRPGTYAYARSSTGGKAAPATTTTRVGRTTTTTTTRPGRRTTTTARTSTTMRVDPSAADERRTATVARTGTAGADEIGTASTTLATGSGEVSGTDTLAWGAGVVVRETAFRLFGGTFACDWTPDRVQVAPALAAGTSWTSASACSGTIRGGQLEGTKVSIERKATHRATGSQPEQVAGRTVTSWAIATTVDVRLDAEELGFTSQAQGTERFAPELGIATGSDITTTVQSFGGSRTTGLVEQLVSLP